MWLAHDGKVFSLTWTSVVSSGAPESDIPQNLLFSCGPEGGLVSLNYYHKFNDVIPPSFWCVGLLERGAQCE